MSPDNFTKSVIALACWRPAQNELHSVMLAVCQVYMNQADAGWFKGNVYECANHWLMENPGEFPDEREPQFQQLLAKIDNVLAGLIPDKTGGAIYFARKSDVAERIEATITMSMGSMIFLR